MGQSGVFLSEMLDLRSFEPVVMTVEYFARVSRFQKERKMDCVSFGERVRLHGYVSVILSGNSLWFHSITIQQW